VGTWTTAADLIELVRTSHVAHDELNAMSWSSVGRTGRSCVSCDYDSSPRPGGRSPAPKPACERRSPTTRPRVMNLANRLAGSAGMLEGRGPEHRRTDGVRGLRILYSKH